MTLSEIKGRDDLPRHIAIIMDGNGRWAKQRGENRIYGHRQGAGAAREVIEASAEIGIGYLTLYAFSTENWNRPDDEIDALMGLMVKSMNDETKTLVENNIKLSVIGDVGRLTEDVRLRLQDTVELTAGATGMHLIVALSYSSRWEMAEAAKAISRDVSRGLTDLSDIDEKLFSSYLGTSGIPDPELLIRTSGELRLSNFLLWQVAYTELYFTETLWPDFGRDDYYMAIADYLKRERRFGLTSEQLSDNK